MTLTRQSPSIGYTLALYLLSPVILAYTLVQALRIHDRRYLRERLGMYRLRLSNKPIWVHAASVGEVMCAEPLIHGLRRRWPQHPVVITTGTPTGADIARRRLPADVKHCYLPIDFPGTVGRFLATLAPSCALIMETELWLNLYSQCAHRRIPILLINGRLSARTLGALPWLRRIYAAALAHVDIVLTRSPRDEAGFVALGASPERVRTIGNIKFAASTPGSATTSDPALTRPYVLAASTHDDEELRLTKLWRARERQGHLLVIAPRHPVRIKTIMAQLLPLSRHIAVRSRQEPINAATEIYIADTLGELSILMAGAEIVFMGGSLIPRGGHNVLEPARLGKAIVFGPHMENFLDEAAILLEHKAAIQVANDDALEACLTLLLQSHRERSELGSRAKLLMLQYKHIAERYVDEIARRCGLTAQP